MVAGHFGSKVRLAQWLLDSSSERDFALHNVNGSGRRFLPGEAAIIEARLIFIIELTEDMPPLVSLVVQVGCVSRPNPDD